MHTPKIMGLLLASLLGTSFAVTPVVAAEGAPATPKEPTCAKQAKDAGITDKEEKKKFLAECNAKRKAATAK